MTGCNVRFADGGFERLMVERVVQTSGFEVWAAGSTRQFVL
jgi:hypothetical protein